jgi:hypothetical protein
VKYYLKGLLFWNNHFYGICAVFLATEASNTLLHKIPEFPILFLIYSLTVFYYTWAYLRSYKNEDENERTKWYQQHAHYLKIRQWILLLLLNYIGFYVLNFFHLFFQAAIAVKCIIVFTAVISVLYYVPFFLNKLGYTIRANGFLKNLTISWVWTFVCCFLPIWLDNKTGFFIRIDLSHFWVYFFQLFVFLFILAVLFDIKDINRDQDHKVNTIVVQYGIIPTFIKLLFPLLLLYLITNFYFYYLLDLKIGYLLGQTLLAFLIFLNARSIIHEKLIYRNILLIDGLMLIKAILGFILI